MWENWSENNFRGNTVHLLKPPKVIYILSYLLQILSRNYSFIFRSEYLKFTLKYILFTSKLSWIYLKTQTVVQKFNKIPNYQILTKVNNYKLNIHILFFVRVILFTGKRLLFWFIFSRYYSCERIKTWILWKVEAC